MVWLISLGVYDLAEEPCAGLDPNFGPGWLRSAGLRVAGPALVFMLQGARSVASVALRCCVFSINKQ